MVKIMTEYIKWLRQNLAYAFFLIILSLAFVLIIFNYPFISDYGRIYNVSIGTDSLIAVRNIEDRASSVMEKYNDDIEIEFRGDTIGYTYVPLNEQFYVVIDTGKVIEVWFTSKSLTENDVLIRSDGVKLPFKGDLRYEGNDIIFEVYNNVYHLYKRK